AKRGLEIVFYDVLVLRGGVRFSSHWEALESLKQWGLPVSNANRKITSADEAARYHAEMAAARDTFRYETDGIVLKVDDPGAQERLGSTSRHPRWAIAYKFPARGEETLIENIVVQVGRTGVLTPVAVLRPVPIGGVIVTRAT